MMKMIRIYLWKSWQTEKAQPLKNSTIDEWCPINCIKKTICKMIKTSFTEIMACDKVSYIALIKVMKN